MPTAVIAAVREGAASRRSRAHAVAQLLSIAPFFILLAVAADPQARQLSPLQPMPGLVGLPADALLSAATLAWMTVGALVIRFARSPIGESVALLVFTIPATIAAALAPAVLLVLVRPG